MKEIDITAEAWPDYELLDSGGNSKLERYGSHLIIRPETQALWQKKDPAAWKAAEAEFKFASGKGSWRKDPGLPESWEMSWGKAKFKVRLTSFKHTGLFPEQAANWQWLIEKTSALEKPRILNLFGYTGIASIVCAGSGAQVTHVDASKQSNSWAAENARLSEIPQENIRYLLDDALKFAEREVRRNAVYEGIILDPPAFGRGPKGEVWHIEEDLPKLIAAVSKLLSPAAGSFLLLNGYAAGYSPRAFLQAAEDLFPGVDWEFGELRIGEGRTGRYLPSGIYARFAK